MNCSICSRPAAEVGELAQGAAGAICRSCASICVDFFGAIDRTGKRFDHIFPTGRWDRRNPNTWVPGGADPDDRRRSRP